MSSSAGIQEDALELAKRIREDVSEDRKSVSKLLRDCKSVCRYLDILDLNEWIELELNGYYNRYATVGELLENIPNYRVGQLIFYNARGQRCPLPYKILSIFGTQPIGEPISQLESLAESSESLHIVGGSVIDELNTYLYKKIAKKDTFKFQGMRVARGGISSMVVRGVVEGVKNRMADFLDDVIIGYHNLQQELTELKSISKGDENYPEYIMVVEGKDDVTVWKGFLQNKGIDSRNIRISSIHGGVTEAISTYLAIKSIGLKNCKLKLVVDSDNDREAVEKKIKDKNIVKSAYHILEEKEIESYLFDAKAISFVTSTHINVVKKQIDRVGKGGKEHLDRVFTGLSLSKPTDQTKQFIAKGLTTIPSEIEGIIREMVH